MATFLISLLFLLPVLIHAKPPNIVFILSDDQDIALGGLKPMEKTRKLLGDSGVTFSNVFATTPICCPSRASILTGSYLHNHNTVNNSLSGGCSSASWQANYERKTFATYLKTAGYTTMYAGKYLNTYGHKDAKGVSHIPPGWDWWVGLVGNSKYYEYTLSVNGSAVHHGNDYRQDYLTDVIKRYGVEFLKQKSVQDSPFLMVLSTPACHAPFTPAPQYKGHFKGIKVPQHPNFNMQSKDKHWLVRMPPAELSEQTIEMLDNIYQSRLETLLSVDDLVEEVVHQLDKIGVLNNTYVIYSSDHGFHIGQFGLPWDKRQPYDFDLRIPLLIRGPNIQRNKVISSPVLNIDFAATFLNIANLQTPFTMDGKSFLHNIISDYSSHVKHRNAQARTFLVEYRGEGDEHTIDPACSFLNGDKLLAECSYDAECKCQDAVNNTYNCIRHVSPHCNMLYCRFKDEENFVELYNLQSDPYQLVNIDSAQDKRATLKYEKTLHKLKDCSGKSCSVYDRRFLKC